VQTRWALRGFGGELQFSILDVIEVDEHGEKM
jgi:hypothetical protein